MTAITIDLSEVLKISREEFDGLNRIQAEFRPSIPLKITYNNICVNKFDTGMKTNPRPVFMDAEDFAREVISGLVATLEADSVKASENSWFIQNRFLSINICLHSYTTYDMSDFVFEDVAKHRTVVSMVAHFDTKYTYRNDKYNEDVFRVVNKLYSDLAIAIAL
jgi:hypothetical protein